ncbi:MAG: LytS/YehU family sensor histidine kinase [Flavobacteriales bacterium]|jgi:LytS/YehU family sensor histidine kinase
MKARYLLIVLLILASSSWSAQDLRMHSQGIDTSWTYLDSEDAILELVAGENLIIQERNATGQWAEIGRMPVNVRNSKLYTQFWFVALLASLLAFVIYLLFRFYLNKSRKEAIMDAKLAHLERTALQAQMNPHFIFNSLNSIQSYIASNENDKANRFLAKFSRLIRAMLNNARAQMITLQEEIDSLQLYMELEKMRFKDKFDFEIVVDEDIETHLIDLPPLLIQPYLENAIIHGMSQKRSQGKINLYYMLKGKYLLATVTDNGIGIEQSKKQKRGDSLHKSVGMTITQKRLQMLDEGGKDRQVKIEEIKDRKGEVLGTKVEVKIRVE